MIFHDEDRDDEYRAQRQATRDALRADCERIMRLLHARAGYAAQAREIQAALRMRPERLAHVLRGSTSYLRHEGCDRTNGHTALGTIRLHPHLAAHAAVAA